MCRLRVLGPKFLGAVLYKCSGHSELLPLYVSFFFRVLVRIVGEAGRVSRGLPALNAFQILCLSQTPSDHIFLPRDRPYAGCGHDLDVKVGQGHLI